MPHLQYTTPAGRTVYFELGPKEVVIGRLSKCDIVISKPTVSRRHARIYRKGERFCVSDMGSSHGTHVNGEWVPAQEEVQRTVASEEENANWFNRTWSAITGK